MKQLITDEVSAPSITHAPGWLLLLCMAAASGASLWVTLRWFADADHVAWIWPVTAVQLGFILPVWKNCNLRRWAIVGGLCGNLLAVKMLGLPLWFAVTISATSAVEVAITGAILARGICGFEDLKDRNNLKIFAAAVLTAPLAGALLASLSTCRLLHHSFIRMFSITALGDSLGIAVILPAILFILTGKYRHPRKLRPHLSAGVLPAVLFVAVSICVFSQATQPILFMIFPPLVLLIMLMGLEGAVFANLVLLVVACYATAHGTGPLWLVHSAAWEERLFLLQIFLWMVVITSLPIGALLDEHRRAEIKANDARAIYLTLLENTSDMIILSSFDGNQRLITAASEALTGWTPDEFAMLDRLSTFHPEDLPVAEMVMQSMREGKGEHKFRYRLRQKAGGWRWVEASARAYFEQTTGEVRGYVGTIRDISSVMKAEREHEQLSLVQQEFEALSNTDALTSMPNRRAFDQAMDQHILGFRAEPEGALLMLDIDYFKSFNDRYGHQAGDECLRKVGQAISSSLLRSVDVAARWGGEEFCVLMPGAPAAVSERIANAILDSVRDLQIHHEGSPEGIVTLSIGIALRNGRSEDPSLWIQRADKALYASKRAGKNCWTADRMGGDHSPAGQGEIRDVAELSEEAVVV